MVIENTVEATPIIDPAITVSILAAPSGRAGAIAPISLRNSAAPIRSKCTSVIASAAPTIENSVG